MNVSSFIAKRYFTSKKKKNFIQILSWISMIGVAIGTMALIIVMSVFNGLEDVLRSVYQTFDPELNILPATGKSFEVSPQFIRKIEAVEGVQSTAQVIEDNALVAYRGQQVVVRLKGIEKSYLSMNKLDTFLLAGKSKLSDTNKECAILGAGVAHELGILLDNDLYEMEIIYPGNVRPGASLNARALQKVSVKPSAIFSVEAAYDESLVLTSLKAAKKVLCYDKRRTSVEVYLENGYSIFEIKSKLRTLLGAEFKVSDSDEQHASLLKAIKIEKLFVYIALTFITLIASFNIFFSLSMLAIEKRRDMAMLFAFGATSRLVKGIFFKQGIIIAFIGSVFGLLAGLLVCYLQQEFGVLKVGMSTSVVQAYPVKVRWTDFAWIGISIVSITVCTAYRPAILAARIKTGY